MERYTQLTSEQRYQIYAFLKAEHTLTFIAEVVGKHKSTISCEIARNTSARATARYKHNGFVINENRESTPDVSQPVTGI